MYWQGLTCSDRTVERVLGQRGLVGKLSLTTTQITEQLTSCVVKVGAT